MESIKKILIVGILAIVLVGCGQSETYKQYKETNENDHNIITLSMMLTQNDLKEKEKKEIENRLEVIKEEFEVSEIIDVITRANNKEWMTDQVTERPNNKEIKKAVEDRLIIIEQLRLENKKWKEGQFVDNFGNKNGDKYIYKIETGKNNTKFSVNDEVNVQVLVTNDYVDFRISDFMGTKDFVSFTGATYEINASSNGEVIVEKGNVTRGGNRFVPVVRGKKGEQIIKMMKSNDEVDVMIRFDDDITYVKVDTELLK